MTDTTAPDAITQVDCEAADALENELGFLTVEEMPKVRAAFARHRRLAAHGAGEGLREAAENLVIGIGMGWDLEGLVGKVNEALALTLPTDAGSTTREGGEAVPAGRYLADRFKWAAPGDQQEDAWLVRFCDRDCGDAIFTGPEAEQEAWAYWERYAPSFNIYVFRLAALATTSSPDASPDSGGR